MCIFNGWVRELKPKVWDLFSNFTTEKLRAVLFWSPLKDTLPVVHNAMPPLKQHIYFSQTHHPKPKNKRAVFSTALLEISNIKHKFVKK
jgi:hypothetical protein